MSDDRKGQSPATRAEISKLDEMAMTPEHWGRAVTDSDFAYGLLSEALQTGPYDPMRARAVAGGIRARIAKIHAGDTSGIEEEMAAQLAWLASVIAYCVRKATASGHSTAADVWWRLALKSQNASLRTALALAAIVKGRPRIVNEGE